MGKPLAKRQLEGNPNVFSVGFVRRNREELSNILSDCFNNVRKYVPMVE